MGYAVLSHALNISLLHMFLHPSPAVSAQVYLFVPGFTKDDKQAVRGLA
jgi:hypothetical protein